MPYCEVTSQKTDPHTQLNNGVKIFYRTYGHGPTKVLLIIGLAGTHESWGPQIRGLTGTETPNDDDESPVGDCSDNEASFGGDGIEVCAFDNRGMGRSSVPTKKSEYTTKIMAKDAIALLDHLGWTKVHIDRRSLSIAVRFLRAKTPEQRAAVDLDTHYSTVNVSLESMSLEEQKIQSSINKAHLYTNNNVQEYLEEYVGSTTRRAILYQEYVKGISATGMQSNYGFEGQVNACWTHKVTRTEIELIRSAGFLVSVIHGRCMIKLYSYKCIIFILYPILVLCNAAMDVKHFLVYKGYISFVEHDIGIQINLNHDVLEVSTNVYVSIDHHFRISFDMLFTITMIALSILEMGFLKRCMNAPMASILLHDVIAQIYHARRLAEKLYPVARMVDLHGGHLVSHERTEEVNQALIDLIKASKMQMKPHEWTNLPQKRPGWMETRRRSMRTNMEEGSNASSTCNMLEKLHLFLLYIVGLFVMVFEFSKRTLRNLKPVRVGASHT
ncbi:hypothetical protein F8388_024666 [Cannabis sativa]|uniref:AB hydrolase-1 domain-containing protein n=1 Tax=Cannabis sativa TaxID=3483 RepID=A0A7J6GBM9_CANSA|nr:hypothetical protein F8388_024666 [Cannabis sativa]